MISYTVDSYKDGMISMCAFGIDLEAARRWANDCMNDGARRVVITRNEYVFDSDWMRYKNHKKTVIADIKAA